MSGYNIISSFKNTGVCPFDRHAFEVAATEKYASFKPQNLAEKTGLAYIPLYSPSRKDREQVLPMTSTPCNSLQCHASFSDSDIGSGCENSRHLQRSFHNTELSVPLRSSTAVSKFLVHPPNPNQISTKHTKSSGCVLTSQENLALLAQKERNKLQEALKGVLYHF